VLALVGIAVSLSLLWPWISDRIWPPPTKVVLAVRPFRNLSGDPGQDFIADGMTEEMITHLGQLHPNEMGVVRLSPAYATVALGRIAKEVGANYVLEGGVRRSAQQIAITAQLIQVSDQTQVWGESYERDLADLLRVQIEVALAITREVVNKLPHAQPKTPQVEGSIEVARSTAGRIINKWSLSHVPTRQVNGEAYLAYLEGRYFWSKRTETGFGKAITAFQRSIEIDPTYAPPYAGLADCYELLGSAPYSTLRPSEAFPKAEAAARKALELDSTLAEAHVSLGYSQMVYEWNYPEARKEFEIALQLRPGYATGHQFYGYYLTAMGQLDAAITERKKALDLDPISPLLHSALGEAYYHARHFDVTIAQNTRALELDPSYAIALVNIGRAYELMGMHQQARDAFQKILNLVPEDPAILALLAHEYAVSGDKASAGKLLDKLTGIARRKYVPAVYFAVMYIGLNRKDDAFRWLDKAYEERCEYLVYLGSEPLADPLRDDPRFASLLARLGLKPAGVATAP
jgi:TolB-like protein/Flp pilus assembly protein TadD